MTWMRANKETQVKVKEHFSQNGRPEELPDVIMWYNDAEDLQAFVAREYCGGRREDPLRWHISVRGMSGVPTWSQMAEAAHAIRPGVFFVIMVPPKSWWMNLHPHVLHIWETDDQALVEEAKANAMGHAPS